MFAGHVYSHDPHSMQSMMLLASVSSNILFLDIRQSRNGSSPIGQALIHLPQRKQLPTCRGCASLSVIIKMPDVPLITGNSLMDTDLPIIGPPLMMLVMFSGSPPAASISSVDDVPILTKKLDGFLTDLPVTVTTLDNIFENGEMVSHKTLTLVFLVRV